MSDTNELKKLIPTIEEMISDPSIQEFYPVLNEMLRGCKVLDYNNTSDVLNNFFDNSSDYVFRKISEAACQNAAMFGHRKKWYEY